MIALNFGFVFMGTLGFFPHGPQGILLEYDLAHYTAGNFIIDLFLSVGLAAMGAIVSNFVKINAFAMIMFTEIFWLPFSKTIGVFWSIANQIPGAAVVVGGFVTLFTILMILFYLFTMVDWSRIPGGI
jgi:hypothetical protein